MKLRNTLQKILVLDAAQSLPHPTADEVHRRISAVHPTVSRGTVYRNLNLLVGQGRLRKVTVPGGADHFDATLCDHYHMYCRVCGRVTDAKLPYQASLLENIPDAQGYVIEQHDIILRGVCPDCRSGCCAGKTV